MKCQNILIFISVCPLWKSQNTNRKIMFNIPNGTIYLFFYINPKLTLIQLNEEEEEENTYAK